MQFILIQLFGYDLAIAEIIVLGAGFVGGVAGFLKAFKDIRAEGWQPVKTKWLAWLRRGKQNAKEISELKDLVSKAVDGIEFVRAELKTNGGGSLKDVVNKTSQDVQKIQARIDHKDEYDTQPIFHLDSNGEMCFANLAFRELLDAEEQDLFHSNYLSRAASLAERQMLDGEITNAIAKRMPFDVTVRFRLSAGRSIAVRLLASPNVLSVRGKQASENELRGFIGTAKEIATATV